MDKKKEKELFKTLINNKVNYHFENLEIVSQSSWIKRIISECEQIWEICETLENCFRSMRW